MSGRMQHDVEWRIFAIRRRVDHDERILLRRRVTPFRFHAVLKRLHLTPIDRRVFGLLLDRGPLFGVQREGT